MSELFSGQQIYADIDLKKIKAERRRMTTFVPADDMSEWNEVAFEAYTDSQIKLERHFDKTPLFLRIKRNVMKDVKRY